MPFAITGFYAGLGALILVFLSVRVIRLRVKHGQMLGDGANAEMQAAIRAQGNFTEYVPFALVLLLLLEAHHTAPSILHGLGILLVAGRVVHAWSIYANRLPLRIAGMVATFAVLLIGAATLILQSTAEMLLLPPPT